MRSNRRNAFTLIEVLIVVIIMAVLAATVIPQFASSTKDAKESSLKFNLQTMRSQIELYKNHHLGNAPTLANFVKQMTEASDVDGATNGSNSPDATHPYGPYLAEIPANSLNGSKTIEDGTGAAVVGTGGWQYDQATGKIYANSTGYLDL